MKTITGVQGDEPKSYQIEVMTCEEYNARQAKAYNQAIEEWKEEKRRGKNNIIPQVAFYYFWDESGNMREDGFVAVSERRHIWAETEKGVEKKMLKSINVI
jgi:hypothetical protein